MSRAIIEQDEASIPVKMTVVDDTTLIGQIEALPTTSVSSLKAGGKIAFVGNGGSFADAQHLSAKFISRPMLDCVPLAFHVLGTNNAAISAIGDDYGYERVCARSLQGGVQLRDVFIPVTTSGTAAISWPPSRRPESRVKQPLPFLVKVAEIGSVVQMSVRTAT